jgi:hypothetical protein
MIPLNGRPKTDLEELKRTPTSDGWKIIFYTSKDGKKYLVCANGEREMWAQLPQEK